MRDCFEGVKKMSQIKVQENVTVTYKNDKITIKGDTFVIEGSLAGSELMKVYWGNTGKGSVKLTLNAPDEPKKIDEKVVEVKEETKKATVPVVPSVSAKPAVSRTAGTSVKPPTKSKKTNITPKFDHAWFDPDRSGN